MFTGIVEEFGIMDSIQQSGDTLKLTVQANVVMSDLEIGDSIAVNGVCLTVNHYTKNQFTMDVMPETFHATSLKKLQAGSKVNLERAMHANGRFGGHFVTGHIDGTGKILQRTAEDNAIIIDISVPKDFRKYLIMKGSIAVDGVSLTVFDHEPGTVTVSIIPHTAKETVLGSKSVGDPVNLEMDMLAKYLYSFMNQGKNTEPISSGISEQLLRENDFS